MKRHPAKTCANIRCRVLFTPLHGRMTYCCAQCCGTQSRRNYYHANREAHKIVAQRRAIEQPEVEKAIRDRSTRKRYRDGKLPSWMYS